MLISLLQFKLRLTSKILDEDIFYIYKLRTPVQQRPYFIQTILNKHFKLFLVIAANAFTIYLGL